MGSKTQYLGQFEELVLRAVLGLHDTAYGLSILKTIEERTSRTTSIGAVYTTLERLEAKGYLESHAGEATPERGNRPKRYYRVTGAGISSLHAAETERLALGRLNGVGLAGGVA